MKQSQEEEFPVTISNAEERIWEGSLHSVSSANSAGKFDILPGHANFVTMIKNEPIVIRAKRKKTIHLYTRLPYLVLK